MERITSRQNPLISRRRGVGAEKKARRAEGVFLCEGVKLVGEALRWGPPPELLVVAEGTAPPAELPALADCPREDARFVLEQLYEADQAGRSLGREAILAAAREAGLPCSQQEVRRILAGLDRAGLVRVSRGPGGTRLTPAGRALCRRQAVEGGAEMV